MAQVKDFMLLPEISRYAVEYGSDLESEVFEANGRQCWLSYIVDGKRVGIINFYLKTGTMGMFHTYILREFKKNYDVMVQEFFNWFLDEMPEQMVKLNVVIPTQFKGAIKAAESAGMTREGVDRMSYLSEDGPCDRILLGIIRREMI